MEKKAKQILNMVPFICGAIKGTTLTSSADIDLFSSGHFTMIALVVLKMKTSIICIRSYKMLVLHGVYMGAVCVIG